MWLIDAFVCAESAFTIHNDVVWLGSYGRSPGTPLPPLLNIWARGRADGPFDTPIGVWADWQPHASYDPLPLCSQEAGSRYG
jgi:hypothetical protein